MLDMWRLVHHILSVRFGQDVFDFENDVRQTGRLWFHKGKHPCFRRLIAIRLRNMMRIIPSAMPDSCLHPQPLHHTHFPQLTSPRPLAFPSLPVLFSVAEP